MIYRSIVEEKSRSTRESETAKVRVTSIKAHNRLAQQPLRSPGFVSLLLLVLDVTFHSKPRSLMRETFLHRKTRSSMAKRRWKPTFRTTTLARGTSHVEVTTGNATNRGYLFGSRPFHGSFYWLLSEDSCEPFCCKSCARRDLAFYTFDNTITRHWLCKTNLYLFVSCHVALLWWVVLILCITVTVSPTTHFPLRPVWSDWPKILFFGVHWASGIGCSAMHMWWWYMSPRRGGLDLVGFTHEDSQAGMHSTCL